MPTVHCNAASNTKRNRIQQSDKAERETMFTFHFIYYFHLLLSTSTTSVQIILCTHAMIVPVNPNIGKVFVT